MPVFLVLAGAFLVIATKEFCAQSVGIETGPLQCAVIAWNAFRNRISSKVEIEAGIFFEQTDVVLAYLTSN